MGLISKLITVSKRNHFLYFLWSQAGEVTLTALSTSWTVCRQSYNRSQANSRVFPLIASGTILVPIALFSSLSRWGLGTRIEGSARGQLPSSWALYNPVLRNARTSHYRGHFLCLLKYFLWESLQEFSQNLSVWTSPRMLLVQTGN